MFNKSNVLAAALGLAMSGTTQPPPLDYGYFPKGKIKPKYKGANPLRGYQARLSHVLSAYSAEKNLEKQANGKSGFKGFRKVLSFKIVNGQLMSVWVKA